MAAGSPRRSAPRAGTTRTGSTARPARPRVVGAQASRARRRALLRRRPVPSRPPTRAERRRAARARRARLGLAISVVASAAMVAAWFPASELAHQRQQLATATTQLDRLQRQDQALAKERQRLENPSEIARIAGEDYQLVSPGSTAYQVLPPAGTSSPGAAYPTDPGSSKPVVPSGYTELPAGATTGGRHTSGSANAEPSSFAGRVLQTLEFWR